MGASYSPEGDAGHREIGMNYVRIPFKKTTNKKKAGCECP